MLQNNVTLSPINPDWDSKLTIRGLTRSGKRNIKGKYIANPRTTLEQQIIIIAFVLKGQQNDKYLMTMTYHQHVSGRHLDPGSSWM